MNKNLKDSNKKILRYDLNLSPKNLKVKNLLNQEFLSIEAKLISTQYPNLNNSYFTKEAIVDAIPTCYNKPVLAAFDAEKNDFLGHESELAYDQEYDNLYYDNAYFLGEVPVGFIREGNKVEVEEDPVTGLYWLKASCDLWVNYGYKLCKKLLKNGKTKLSVEVEVYDSYEDEKGIEIIKKFKLIGFSILGQNYTEAIPGASLTIPELMENSIFQKQAKKLQFAYNSLDKNNKETKETKENFEIGAPDNKDPIKNENPKEEITMENSNENSNQKFENENDDSQQVELTYNNKRDIVNKELNKIYAIKFPDEEIFIYVIDLSDNFVIFEYNRGCYRVKYRLDDEYNCYIDMGTIERVINSWQPYTEKENDMDEKDMKTMSKECEEKDQACKTVEEKEQCEKEVCETEEKVECEKEECEKEECEKEVCEKDQAEAECPECHKPMSQCECKSTESAEDCCKESACDDKMCNSEDDCVEEKECNSTEEKECDSECNPEEKECNSKGCNEEKECNSTEEKECNSTDFANVLKPDGTVCSFVMIGNEKLDINQLYDKFCALSSDYTNMVSELDTVKADFSALNEKYTALTDKFKSQEIAEYIKVANEMVDNEKRLYSAEKKEEIKNIISEKCNKSEFATVEDVKKFTVSTLAMALYEQKDNGSNEKEGNNRDFSVTINRENNSNPMSKHSKAEDLIQANEKLKYI